MDEIKVIPPMVIDAGQIGFVMEAWKPEALAKLLNDIAAIAIPHAHVEIAALRIVSDGPDFVDGDV